jgi:hypothetical protein
VASLERRISFGQFSPLRPGAQDPQHTVQYGTCVVPWATALIGTPPRPQHRLYRLPTARQSVPNGHASARSEITRASSEWHQRGSQVFMRLVLVGKLRKYIRAYAKSAKPFRWTYTDPKHHIRTYEITETAH